MLFRSKAGIDILTLGLAREVATEGIRVNAVRPGIIDTDIHASGGLPDRAKQLAPQVPMQRAGSAVVLAMRGDAVERVQQVVAQRHRGSVRIEARPGAGRIIRMALPHD